MDKELSTLKKAMETSMPFTSISITKRDNDFIITAKLSICHICSVDSQIISGSIEIDQIELNIFNSAIKEDQITISKQFATYLAEDVGNNVARAIKAI